MFYAGYLIYRNSTEYVFDWLLFSGELGLEESGHVLHVLRLGRDLFRITKHILDCSLKIWKKKKQMYLFWVEIKRKILPSGFIQFRIQV